MMPAPITATLVFCVMVQVFPVRRQAGGRADGARAQARRAIFSLRPPAPGALAGARRRGLALDHLKAPSMLAGSPDTSVSHPAGPAAVRRLAADGMGIDADGGEGGVGEPAHLEIAEAHEGELIGQRGCRAVAFHEGTEGGQVRDDEDRFHVRRPVQQRGHGGGAVVIGGGRQAGAQHHSSRAPLPEAWRQSRAGAPRRDGRRRARPWGAERADAPVPEPDEMAGRRPPGLEIEKPTARSSGASGCSQISTTECPRGRASGGWPPYARCWR